MKKFRILAIDGGGIRGVIPAVWLAGLAKKLPDPLAGNFDLIVGTSTGSILATAIGLGKNVESCVDLYNTFGNKIFPRKFFDKNGWSFVSKWIEPTYSDQPLADALQRLFSIDATLAQCTRPTMIVSYDVLGRNMYLMKSYDKSTSSIPVWEACKSSSSAPTYFPAHILKHDNAQRPLIDGGVFANNPSILAISEAVRINKRESLRDFHLDGQIALVSLGTGSLQRRIHPEDARTWGPVQWVRPLLDVMFDGSSELSHFCAHHILTSKNYVRMQVDLNGVNDDMDDASTDNIEALKTVALSLLDSPEGSEKVDQIVALLTS